MYRAYIIHNVHDDAYIVGINSFLKVDRFLSLSLYITCILRVSGRRGVITPMHFVFAIMWRYNVAFVFFFFRSKTIARWKVGFAHVIRKCIILYNNIVFANELHGKVVDYPTLRCKLSSNISNVASDNNYIVIRGMLRFICSALEISSRQPVNVALCSAPFLQSNRMFLSLSRLRSLLCSCSVRCFHTCR